jgi:hypothetical protein
VTFVDSSSCCLFQRPVISVSYILWSLYMKIDQSFTDLSIPTGSLTQSILQKLN